MGRVFFQVVALLSLLGALLSAQEVSSNTSIPRVLHFIHLSDEELSETEKDNIRLWIEKNPGYKAQLWSSSYASSSDLTGVEYRKISDLGYKVLSRAFATAESFSAREQILSYEILLHEGGVFVDDSKDACAFLDPLVSQYDLFYSVVPQENHSDYGSLVIGAMPDHPAIKKTIEDLCSHEFILEESIREKVSEYLKSAVEANKLDKSLRFISIPSSAFQLKDHDLSTYVFDAKDPHQSDIEKLMNKSLARLKVQSSQFMSHFFALIALSLICVVMLVAIIIKIKQRYFS